MVYKISEIGFPIINVKNKNPIILQFANTTNYLASVIYSTCCNYFNFIQNLLNETKLS